MVALLSFLGDLLEGLRVLVLPLQDKGVIW